MEVAHVMLDTLVLTVKFRTVDQMVNLLMITLMYIIGKLHC